MASYSRRSTAHGVVWDVRFLADMNGSKKLIHRSGFSSRREAELAYLQFVREGVKVKEESVKVKFEDAFQKYLKAREGDLSQNSLYNLEGSMSKHVLPSFRGCIVSEVSKADVIEWQADLWSSGLKNGACRTVRSYFVTFMAWASDVYSFPNPFQGVKAPHRREEAPAHVVWSVDDFSQFINLGGLPHELNVFFSVAFFSGARVGEVLALTSEDFVKVNGAFVISISKSANAEREGFDIVSPTKNDSSVRRVSLPASLTGLLEEFLAVNVGPYVFGGSRPWGRSKVSEALKAGISKAGVPSIRVHDLRHSHASILIACGIPIPEVSRRLGHASVAVTMSTYAHCIKADEASIVGALDSSIQGAGLTFRASNSPCAF